MKIFILTEARRTVILYFNTGCIRFFPGFFAIAPEKAVVLPLVKIKMM